MLMMEGTYGWIEVGGLQDKSSASTTDRYRKGARDILTNTGQNDKKRPLDDDFSKEVGNKEIKIAPIDYYMYLQ